MQPPARIRAIAFGLIVLMLPPCAVAAQHPMYFRHLTLQDGLSQNTVTSVFQDSQGFLWLGTENGLNRYDGYTTTRYYADREDPGSLQGDFVWDIAEDRQGDLWIATANRGAARWNRRHDVFETYRHDPDDAGSLSSDSVRTLMIDQSGRVWLGTLDAGLNVLDRTSGRIVRYRHDPEDAQSLSSDKVYAVYQDRAGIVWVGTDAGLNRFNAGSGTFIRYPHQPDDPASVSTDRIRDIRQDSQGALWVATFGGGLSRLNPTTGQVQRYRHDPDDPGSLPHDHVRAILEDHEQRLWVGTADGLSLLDRSTGTFQTFRNEPGPESLADSYVMSLYQDRSHLLWVGTRSGGANIWNPRSWSLGHYMDGWLQDTNVTAFASDAERLWVGTFDNGLTLLDNEQVEARYGSAELGDERVMALLRDRAGALWIGTMEAGLSRLAADGSIERFRHDPGDPASLGADGIMSLHQDRSGRVWVGTFGGGANRYDPGTGSFVRISQDQGLSSSRATTIVDDLEGAVWIGTDAGLNRLNPETGEITRFHYDPADSRSLSADQIYALHVDHFGRLWVGTAGSGLNVLDDPARPGAGFSRIGLDDGLPSNLVYGVQSDAGGRLWIATNNGVARLDPRSGAVKRFHRAHGLQGEEFNFGAHHRSDAGVVYFGGANGFNAIRTGQSDEPAPAPEVVLTGIEKMNLPATTDVAYPLLDTLTVGYDESVVTFEFAALDFTSPEQNRYSYLLEGFDSTWTDPGPVTRATYTNLDAGDYVFRVRAANSDGVWNEQGLNVAVHVAPPPWRTGWAYTGYGLLLTLLIGSAVQEQRRKRRLEQEHRDRLYQLAYFDQLTGTPNRQLFMKRLADAIEAEEGRLALVYIDLDDFKRINDTLGHHTGDELLKLVTERLRSVAETTRHAHPRIHIDLARLGGDEFVMLVAGLRDDQTVQRLARRVIDAFACPFEQGNRTLVVTPSIGISVYPSNGRTAAELMKNADAAMYEAKNAGRNEYSFYSPEMNARALESLALEGDLRSALEGDQLHMVYQPKVELSSGRTIGCEALIRWTHPRRGDISPAKFIPIAERTGLILDLDRWVVNAVCAQLGAWLAAGITPVPVAVNLSGREFGSSDLAQALGRAVARAGVPPELLEIEITESVLMHNPDVARVVLGRLRSQGFSIAVDDFGTGYSSLSYLKNFPLSALKIDRAFVKDVCHSTDDQAICQAVIAMAHGMGLGVVAEGIETRAQADYLMSLGCDYAQGFHFHRPMAPEALADLIAPPAPHVRPVTPGV